MSALHRRAADAATLSRRRARRPAPYSSAAIPQGGGRLGDSVAGRRAVATDNMRRSPAPPAGRRRRDGRHIRYAVLAGREPADKLVQVLLRARDRENAGNALQSELVGSELANGELRLSFTTQLSVADPDEFEKQRGYRELIRRTTARTTLGATAAASRRLRCVLGERAQARLGGGGARRGDAGELQVGRVDMLFTSTLKTTLRSRRYSQGWCPSVRPTRPDRLRVNEDVRQPGTCHCAHASGTSSQITRRPPAAAPRLEPLSHAVIVAMSSPVSRGARHVLPPAALRIVPTPPQILHVDPGWSSSYSNRRRHTGTIWSPPPPPLPAEPGLTTTWSARRLARRGIAVVHVEERGRARGASRAAGAGAARLQTLARRAAAEGATGRWRAQPRARRMRRRRPGETFVGSGAPVVARTTCRAAADCSRRGPHVTASRESTPSKRRPPAAPPPCAFGARCSRRWRCAPRARRRR